MSNMTTNLLFIKALRAYLERIEELLGDDWLTFRKTLQQLLDKLVQSENDDKVSLWIDEIYEMGQEGRAGDLIRSLFKQATTKAGNVDSKTRSIRMLDPTSHQTREVDLGLGKSLEMYSPTTTRSSEVSRKDVETAAIDLAKTINPRYAILVGINQYSDNSVSGEDAQKIAQNLETLSDKDARKLSKALDTLHNQQYEKKTPQERMATVKTIIEALEHADHKILHAAYHGFFNGEEAITRYLNVGFFSTTDNAPVPLERPLALHGKTYRLGVNIGQFWGIGRSDISFPDELLTPYFEEKPELTVDVIARSFDIGLTPVHQQLSISEKEDSPLIFFDLTLSRTGRQAIDVDVLFYGHLLQSRRIEVFIVAHPKDQPPESAWPMQDSYITFTRTATLNKEHLKPLVEHPRRLTIVAERDLDYNRIGLRFYDNTGIDLGFQQSTLSDANLIKALSTIRDQLVKTMHAYTGQLGSSEAVLTKHLGQLAAIGRRFYLALLPGLTDQENIADTGQQLSIDLPPGSVIQVTPLSSQLSVPWELLYERKIEAYREGRISLCPTFREHGPDPEDCPGFGNPTVVCPYGFWGYQYIIEQLPRRLDPHVSLPSHSLPMFIRNDLPLRFTASVYSKFRYLEDHLNALRALAHNTRLDFIRADSLEQVKANLVESGVPSDILYFYTHGGQDAFDVPYLEVGSGDQIQLIDLDAWGVKLDTHHPLVVLNACDSADYSPDSFESLLKFFCDAGAAGVIGTQCEVKEKLAHTFMLRFFQAFLCQVPVGQALFESRQTLLREYLDPRGLAYSLFAAAEVRLAQPVIGNDT